MNAVGRIGSYLSRGMYTVSAPFHPFGGAVDIVVVEQPDGSFRSSPWYVRFGKFQGVLKSKEKIVKIMVNGDEADLFMYLSNCGQSYFSREADDDEYAKYGDEVVIRPSSLFEQMKSQDRRRAFKSRSCDFGAIDVANCNAPIEVERYNSLDSAEIAAQLLEVQWSTTLTTKSCKEKAEVSHFSAPCSPRGVNCNMLVIDDIIVCSEQDEARSRKGDSVLKEKDHKNQYSQEMKPKGESFVDENNFKGHQCSSATSPEDQFLFSDLDESKLSGIRLSLSSSCSDDSGSVDEAWVLSDASDNEDQPADAGRVPRQSREILKPINGEKRESVVSGQVKSLAESLPNLPPKLDNLNALESLLIQSVNSKSKPLNLPLPRKEKRSTISCAAKGSQIVQNQSNIEGKADSFGGEEANLLNPEEAKKMLKVLTPTSEQVASLDLKEGSNIVTFTFSTSMLGDQKVDARIYLWKWDSKVIVSDVDGTITRSDVLGQCMPLVGIDWSQAGVARLFSAIRENGYRLLFLSARSISQASVTRQFLLNLKQDGLPLPDGPVVISPDGLFPSLYREVIKRAPHEFKIACLEDIKALFPSECSPFYAGFGNRDTDEISYLKVGIPKGKIFIINPKGEVVVNRHVHAKTYTSIHTLVNETFPPITSSEHEQEGFNSWNFWKLPPPTVDG